MSKTIAELTVDEFKDLITSIVDEAVDKALIRKRVKRSQPWKKWSREDLEQEVKHAFRNHKLEQTQENFNLYYRFLTYYYDEEVSEGLNRLKDADSWNTHSRVGTFIKNRKKYDQENQNRGNPRR